MIEQLNIIPKGWVKAYLIDEQGNEVIAYDDHNDITGLAKTILAHCLGGDNWKISHITAFKAGLQLYSAPVDVTTYPNTFAVQFSALFDYNSFNDTLDELRLDSSLGGTFSEIFNLAVNKSSAVKLRIVWTISLTDCSNPSFTGIGIEGNGGEFVGSEDGSILIP